MKICVVIPTYNEAGLIGRIVQEVLALGLFVLVVDDGSIDGTGKIALSAGATLIKNTSNEGKGFSLAKGFKYALENNFDVVITMDGDGQHLSADIAHFIQHAESSASGVFIGNRMKRPRGMPMDRFLTNKFMSWFISLIAGQKIPDTQCGFRLIKKEVLKKINLKTDKFEAESELLIEAVRAGFIIEAVVITTIYKGGHSRINPFIDTLRFIRFMVKDMLRWTIRH